MEDGLRHSVSCWKIGCVSEMPFFTWDHFWHRESAVNCVNIQIKKVWCRCPPIWTIFHQLLSFIYSSMISWWWAIPVTSSKEDHKVSSISPSTCPVLSIKFRLYLGKQSGIMGGKMPLPNCSSDLQRVWKFQELWFGNMLPEMNDPLTAYVIYD